MKGDSANGQYPQPSPLMKFILNNRTLSLVLLREVAYKKLN
ncbi:hypothetical protein FBY05_13223 [Pseudomonas sp. SJZ083]|uniref:Uncharacterized protein n=1 Tax=Pseudomonas fluorescens TaxID=294 RepID=A0A5E7GNN9_PSEFL|nr:hypothetical protein [Pseudomonas silensiensis]TWC12328.1 hypothetical protein FBY05_13223 [Pseudomonas sp. SJZ083]TWC40796.1 hypothetical protein FBY01_13241 [Pseudomonas sp. SJZ077]VVO53178.1 hypothetical protein PS870_00409 [Pseudomonas fluorescens]